MNDIIIMNQSQSIGISGRGRALGFGHALGPWALGPGLGPGRHALHAGPAAAWAQVRAQGPWGQGPPKAQGPASSADANALALIHDDNIIHMSAISNSIIGCPNLNISPYVQWCVKGSRTFSGHSHI